MKYSQLVGVVAALAIIGLCFVPWIYIPSVHITVTGLHAEGTSFGKPGLLSIYFSTISIVFFLIPRIWSKRANVFIATINFAWAIRNYILLTACLGGECPEKKAGLYLLVLASLVVLLMSFFPKITVKSKEEV
jgi:hypothetical protein